MSDINEGINDPILGLNSKTMKNDILLFKNETLKDFKEAQKKVSSKYNNLDLEIKEKLNSYERRITAYESKIIELAKLINTDNSIREKVDKLMQFKEKADDSMLTEKIRLDNVSKDLTYNVNRIYQILKDSVIYPGTIGGICKYKTFHDFIDYVLTQCSQNLTFREKSIIDFKSYKTKLENTISSFNTQINSLLNTTNEFTKKCVKECEERFHSIYNVYDDRLQDARIENANYAIGLEKAMEVLKKELENLYVIKKNLYEKVDNGLSEMKKDNIRVIKIVSSYKKQYHLLEYKFTQLSEFIKDIRFRTNLKEDVRRREFVQMSDLINFEKRKKGFMDGFEKNYLKKEYESQIKNYISGKITAEEVFKKKDSKSTKKNENEMREFFKRKSMSMSGTNISFSEGRRKLSFVELMRGSMALPNKNMSLESEILKNAEKDGMKKNEIKEEEEDSYSSKDFDTLLKKNIPKELIQKKNETSKNLPFQNKETEIISENDNSKKLKRENSKIRIVSKDKEDGDNGKDKNNIKTFRKSSLKNVIQDMFNVKKIMENIKEYPTQNANEKKENKNEKKTPNKNINNDRTKNISNNNDSIYSDIKNDLKSNKKNLSANSNKTTPKNNIKDKNNNDQNKNIQNVNVHIKKIEMKNINQKTINNRDRDNILLLAGQIKQKVLSPNFNNHQNSNINSNSLKSLNFHNNNFKGMIYRNNVKNNNNSFKTHRGLMKDDYKTSEKYVLNNFMANKDINVDDKNYLMKKKKNI